MQKLATFIHGSHIYNLNTEKSDQDFVTVFVPDLEDYLNCKVTHTFDENTSTDQVTNTSEDVDHSFISINYFIDNLVKSDMKSMDMLFCDDKFVTYYNKEGKVIENGNIGELTGNGVWQLRVLYRRFFVTKSADSIIRYCLRQGKRYGIKGSIIHSFKEVQEVLGKVPSNTELRDIKDLLPLNEHCFMEKSKFYSVGGKKYQLDSLAGQVHSLVQSRLDFIEDVEQDHDSIKWKDISHIFRACNQAKSMINTMEMEVYLTGSKRDFILSVKQGKLSWSTVKPLIEKEIEELQKVCDNNPLSLPNEVNLNIVHCIKMDIIKKSTYM